MVLAAIRRAGLSEDSELSTYSVLKKIQEFDEREAATWSKWTPIQRTAEWISLINDILFKSDPDATSTKKFSKESVNAKKIELRE